MSLYPTPSYMKQIITGLKKNPGVWPVCVFAFGFAPLLVAFQSYHQMSGPDTRFSRDFEPWNRFDNKKFKYISGEDYKNYEHPRPRYMEE